jgi:hypothetical protein
MSCVAECNLPRYKIIVQSTIGQLKDQGVRVASRCLWDTSVDNYAAVNFQNVSPAKSFCKGRYWLMCCMDDI